MKPWKPLRRSTKPIKRSPLRSCRKRIRTRKADPAKRAFAKHRVPAFQAFIRTLQCVVGRECWGWTECAHLKTRGSGGDDLHNIVPLCHAHHVFQHQYGLKETQEYWNVDLWALAAQYADEWLQSAEGAKWVAQHMAEAGR